MTKIYKTYLAQLNPSVGNIKNNLGLVKDSWEKARALNSDLLITPELVVTGYPPEDLLLRPAFIEQIKSEVLKFIEFTSDGGPAIILGTPWVKNEEIYNAYIVIDDGKLIGENYKNKLPNYGVFDEERFFSPSNTT